MPRESKVHYRREWYGRSQCGTDGRTTCDQGEVTCRACWFHILATVAPWARGFLDELRGKARPSQLDPVTIPGASTEPVNGKVKGLGDGFARAFRDQGRTQKAIREILAVAPTRWGPIKEVMERGGPPAEPIGVQEGQIAEQPGDAGQVSDEARGDFQPPV